jgi:HlyD family secretion protein
VWSILLGFIAIAGVMSSHLLRERQRLPDGLIAVNGRLEGDAVKISGKQPGRIRELLVREGDSVHTGQTLVRFDDEALKARHDAAQAALEVARRRAEAGRASLEVAARQVPLDIGAARAVLAAAQADLDKARAAELQARRDQARGEQLVRQSAIDLQAAERLSLALSVSESEHQAAVSARERTARALDRARLGTAQLRATEAEVRVLEAAVEQASAHLAEVRTALNELTVESPVTGTVTARFVNLGEIVTVGAPLFEVVDLDSLYMRAYVPEPSVGRVHVGSEARIYTDARPDEPIEAELRYIASRAEFTPKEVQTPDERVKLVYAVKLYLRSNPERRWTPGISADATIRWRDDAPWTRPRW